MRRRLILVAATLLTACGRAEDGPDQITADDQQQLNEAAAMLDANSVAIEEVTEDEGAAAATNAR